MLCGAELPDDEAGKVMPMPVPKRAEAMLGISRKRESSKMIFRMVNTPIVKKILYYLTDWSKWQYPIYSQIIMTKTPLRLFNHSIIKSWSVDT